MRVDLERDHRGGVAEQLRHELWVAARVDAEARRRVFPHVDQYLRQPWLRPSSRDVKCLLTDS